MDDVLVIGAGSAGNHAALRMASRGYRVTVIDKRNTIGDKLCSGIVGAECLRHFPASKSMVYRDARTAMVYGPSGDALTVSRDEPQAYVLDRVAYVASFAERARQAGASYLLGHTLQSLTVDRDGVNAVAVNGAGPETLKARAVIVASGFGSRIPRMAGLGQVRDYVIGAQLEVIAPDAQSVEVYVGKTFAPGFFAWLVPTSKGQALLGLLARRDSGLLLSRLLMRLQQEGKVTGVVSRAKRWGIPLRPIPRAYGNRVIAVGDAAGQVKPATGGGIYYSLLSSGIVADTLDRAIHEGDLSASFLSRYEREWEALVGDELDVGYGARRLLETLSDKQLDYLIKTLAGSDPAGRIWESPGVSFDWHGRFTRTLLRTPVLRAAFSVLGVIVPQVLRTPRR